jgi:hypothetical protein
MGSCFYGPKGTYVIEFRTLKGDVLAISCGTRRTSCAIFCPACRKREAEEERAKPTAPVVHVHGQSQAENFLRPGTS